MKKQKCLASGCSLWHHDIGEQMGLQTLFKPIQLLQFAM
jgi:hypothetical protein